MADTTTTLNAGSGGDSMDESLAYQADGTTTAKRPRVELALSDEPASPGIPQLVNKTTPLPTVAEETNDLLRQILAEVQKTNELLFTLANS